MKLFPKLMLALLVLAVLAPFTLLRENTGKTLMRFSDLSLPDFKLPDMSDLPSSSKLVPASGKGQLDVFYQWHDASGVIQFTTEPPPPGIDYTIKEFDPDTNLIQAVGLPGDEKIEQASEPVVVDKEPSLQIGNPYNPDDVRKLFEDTRNIEDKLQQRFENQNSALN